MTEQPREDVFGLGGVASEARDAEADSQWLRTSYCLPYNPFPPSGISPEEPEGPPLKDEVGREVSPQIRNFIMSAYSEPSSTKGLVIIGAYGTGKSHLLRLMHHQINEWLGSGEQKALSIYVQRPRVEAQDVNREVLRSLGEDTIRKMLWYCMKGEIAQDIETRAQTLHTLRDQLEGPLFAGRGANDAHDRFSQMFKAANLDDHRKFLSMYDAQGWPREGLRDYFTGLLARSLQTDSPVQVLEAYVALLLAPDAKSRGTWDSLLALGRTRRLPLMAAPEFLQDLLNLFRANGYVYTFLLVDEFEEVPAGYLLTRRQKADYMYTLMEMLNTAREGLGLVLAITPQAWEVLTAEATPLKDRLPTVIRLGPLDPQSIARLIEFYLNRARQDASIKASSALFPFSQELIDAVASSLPDRTPRNVLQFAHQVISQCVADRTTQITLETIDAVISDFLQMKAVEPHARRVDGR